MGNLHTHTIMSQEPHSLTTQDLNICLTPKVGITRDLALEKHLLEQPAKIVQRRQTTQVALKIAKNIPIGFRGRKRRSIQLLFIGIQPNPDGRMCSPRVQPSINNISGSIQSRRMTMPTTSRQHLVSPPPEIREESDIDETSIDIREESDTVETTMAINYEQNMGRLHYSSSDDE